MKYLVPFDFTDSTKSALLNVVHFVKPLDEIHVLHVVDNWHLKASTQTKLVEYCSNKLRKFNVHFKVHVIVGEVFTKINEFAIEWSMDMVILGNHALNNRQKMLGSDAIRVIDQSNRPFIMFQQNAKLNEIKRIVVPLSIDNQSLVVLDFAIKLSQLYHAEVHLVGRKQKGDVNSEIVDGNIAIAKSKLISNQVKFVIELLDVTKSKFADSLLQYCVIEIIDVIACTFFADTTLPIFENFVQKLIVNEKKIPVLVVNANSKLIDHVRLFDEEEG